MGRDFCNETERQSLGALFKPDMDIKPLYTYLCPVIIFVCFFSIIFNAILMSISRQSKLMNRSPILLLSLNLAVTDLIASLLNGLGILFNSYLPEVFNIKMGQCSMLMLEVVRCAALIASALHLLALAFVHYRGIVNPLHYRSTIFFSQHRSRTINIISVFCWLIPLTIMIVWFWSTPCQGFQSAECDYLFLLGFAYRYMVLSVFLLPLILMSIIYVRIFLIISRHQRGRRVGHKRSTLTRGVISVAGPISSAAAVNLPDLMSKSRDSSVAGGLERCAHCQAASCADSDREEQTVSMLSEEVDAGGNSVASCSSVASLDKMEEASVAPTADRNNLLLESTSVCDNLARDHHQAENQTSRAATIEDKNDETDTCGGARRPADKALVFVLDGGGAPTVKLAAAGANGAQRSLVRLKRAATTGATNPRVALSLADHASATAPTGDPQQQEQHAAARLAGEPGVSTPRQFAAREILRSKLSLGSRTATALSSPESTKLTYDQKSPAVGGSSLSSVTSRPHRRPKQQQQQQQQQHSNGGSSQLDNLLLKRCTCDNKLRQQQQQRSQRTGTRLTRANTIASNAQRTTREPARTSAAAAAKTGSSIAAGGGDFVASSFRLQLRHSATSPGEATGAGRITTTTAMLADDNATRSTTTVTKTNSNSLAKSASVQGSNTPSCLGTSQTLDAVGMTRDTSRTINNRSSSGAATASQQQHQHEPTRLHVHASAVPQTNTKALITTLLILGTYFVSYAPAIIYQVLTCIDHCPYPLYDISYGRRVFFGAMTTLLLIAKSIVDPLIYSYRMNEIQVAINRYLSKRRSKTSSQAASMYTSQRFTFGTGNSNYLNHSTNHHSFHKSGTNHINESQANSSLRILNSANASLRANSGLTTPHATSQPESTVTAVQRLNRQATSTSVIEASPPLKSASFSGAANVAKAPDQTTTSGKVQQTVGTVDKSDVATTDDSRRAPCSRHRASAHKIDQAFSRRPPDDFQAVSNLVC